MRMIARRDNLEALRELPDQSIQLVYMDPPFNTRRAFGVHVSSRQGDGGDGLRFSFADALDWGEDSERDLRELKQALPRPAFELIAALCSALHRGTAAYLVMMSARLAHAHRVLAAEGNLFLHCDPTASHYLKVVLDAIFGAENFRNEVVWRRTHAHGSARRFSPIHDSILFYSRGRSYVWTDPRLPYSREYVEKFFRHEDERGRYQLITCTGPGDRTGTRAHYRWRGAWPPPGRHWAWTSDEMERLEREGFIAYSAAGVPRRKHYMADGRGLAIGDVWDDISRLDSHSTERVGFETQKPVELLARIVTAASERGATVLDPFGGSGTTAVAAEAHGRGWMLVDASLAACSLALGRVREHCDELPVEVVGFPSSVDRAMQLRVDDRHTYGLWGTSILGTLHDRVGSADSVATGRGRAASSNSMLRSWVPLKRGARLQPLLNRHAASVHRLLVAPADDLAAASSEIPGVVEVPLDACVSARARRDGLAVTR